MAEIASRGLNLPVRVLNNVNENVQQTSLARQYFFSHRIQKFADR